MNIEDRIEFFLGDDLDEQKGDYQKFFKKKLAQWKVKSPSSLSDADKKKFFAEIKKEWGGKGEEK